MASPRAPRHWLIKSEPHVYPWSQLERDRKTSWDGVRNFEARNNLRTMLPGDLALYYHSGDGKALVGVARICSHPRPDETAAPGEDWVSVDVEPLVAFERPVTLADVKGEDAFATFPLVTRTRLSVAPVTHAHFDAVLKRASTRLPRGRN